MGFFSKLFSNPKKNTSIDIDKPNFDTPRVQFAALMESIPVFKHDLLKLSLESLFQSELTKLDIRIENENLILFAKINQDDIIVASHNSPFSEEILNKILPICHIDKEIKKQFYKSQSHLYCIYLSNSTPPHIQFERLFSFIDMILAQIPNPIGIVNETAWTAYPYFMFDQIRNETEELYKGKSMPFMTWLLSTGGCVKYVIDYNNIWYVTKNNLLFGIPEFAFKGSAEKGEFAMQLFNANFAYMYFYKKNILPGNTAEMGNLKLRFSKPYEYFEIFDVKRKTLVIEPIE